MDKLKYFEELLNSLPSDYYDNSEIPNETEMIKTCTLMTVEECNLLDEAIEIIQNNPCITLDEFEIIFYDFFPPMEIVDDDELDEEERTE